MHKNFQIISKLENKIKNSQKAETEKNTIEIDKNNTENQLN